MSPDNRRNAGLPRSVSYVFDAAAVLAFCFGLVVLSAGLGSGTVPTSMFAGGAVPLALGCAHLYYRIREGRPEESRWEANSDDETTEDPLSILQTRYARGEIDDAEFERRVDRLLGVEVGDDEDRETELDRLAR